MTFFVGVLVTSTQIGPQHSLQPITCSWGSEVIVYVTSITSEGIELQRCEHDLDTNELGALEQTLAMPYVLILLA